MAREFRKLYAASQRAKELADLREERVHDIAKAVLKELGRERVGIEGVTIHNAEVYVEYGWSSRGSSSSSDIVIPLSVFEAEDHVAAAKVYAEALKEAKEKATRAEKEKEFNRLRTELNR